MSAPLDNENLYQYFQQKYRLHLGDDRGACGYYIDPSDAYETGGDRFFTVMVRRGTQGTACRGYVAFQPLVVNCQKNTIEILRLEPPANGDARFSSWQKYPLGLSRYNEQGNQIGNAQDAVQQVCALPTRQETPAP